MSNKKRAPISIKKSVIKTLNHNIKSSAFFLFKLFKLLLQPYRIHKAIFNRIGLNTEKFDEMNWDKRADEFGRYSVIGRYHTAEEYNDVTKQQKELLYSYLVKELNGSEKLILDFGCGVGRFTSDLAELINGKAIGVDSTKKLIELCPKSENTTYIHSNNFFNENKSKFDVIFICSVLGGIPTNNLNKLADQISLSLNENGLLFIVEHTGKFHIERQWRTLTIREIKNKFLKIDLHLVGSYIDVNRFSIFSGRKTKITSKLQ